MTRAELNKLLKLSSLIRGGELDLTLKERRDLASYFEELARELRSGAEPKPKSSGASEQVLEFLSKQPKGRRVFIADVLEGVDADKAEVGAALIELQKQGKLVLYRLDNPQEITPRIERSAIQVAGNPRHIFYVE